jgi:hypothetical protein
LFFAFVIILSFLSLNNAYSSFLYLIFLRLPFDARVFVLGLLVNDLIVLFVSFFGAFNKRVFCFQLFLDDSGSSLTEIVEVGPGVIVEERILISYREIWWLNVVHLI